MRRQRLRARCQPRYLLRDIFDYALAAGSVNNTPAVPGPGLRTVTDTESKLSLSGGQLSISGGKASPAWGDPGLWYEARSRTAGRLLLATLAAADVTNSMEAGWDTAQSGALSANALRIATDLIYPYSSGAAGPALASVADGTTYYLAVVLRATGALCFIKGGAFTNWTLLWPGAADSTATLYPGLANYNAALTANNLRIPRRLWLPVPLASDSFNRADGALGSTDGQGHAEGNGGSGLAWTHDVGAWAVSSNKAVGTPTQGAEILTNLGFETYTGSQDDGVSDTFSGWNLSAVNDGLGDKAEATATVQGGANALKLTYTTTRPVAGHTRNVSAATWLQCLAYSRGDGSPNSDGLFYLWDNTNYNSLFYGTTGVTGVAYQLVVRTTRTPGNCTQVIFFAAGSGGAGKVCYYDDCSLKTLTLSSLFSSVAVSTPDVLAEAAVTLTSGTQAGLVLNLDSAASPANFVVGYHNGTNAILEKCVAGVYTTLISAAATYGAGNILRVIKDGQKYRLYYNNALIGAEATISDAGIINNRLHGLFSTYNGNSLDQYVIFARGTQGEYAVLDTL